MTKQITVYEFSELEKDVQESIIKRFNYHDSALQEIKSVFLQGVTQRTKEYIESLGFYDVTISWRLAYSQGDHVTIKARMYQDELLGFFSGGSLIKDYDDLRFVDYIELEVNNYRKISWECAPASLYNDDGELSANIQYFRHILEELLKDSARSLYNTLQDEDAYLSSDAYISDFIAGNGILFTKNGIRV